MAGKKIWTDFHQGESSIFDQGRIQNAAFNTAFEKICNLSLENQILTRRLGTVGLLPSGTQPGLDRFTPGAGPLAFDKNYLYGQSGVATLQSWLTSILSNIIYSYTIPNALSDTWICTNEGGDPANHKLLYFPALNQPLSRAGAGALPDIKLKTYYPNAYQGNQQVPTAWVATTAYTPGMEVTSGGNTYLCIVANTNQVPPNITYWTLQSAYNSGWALPTFDTSGNNEVGGDAVFSFMGRIFTINNTTGAIRASRSQTYQEYGKFSSGTTYATAGDTTTTPSWVQKLDGLQTFAPIPPWFMDDPATPSINEAAWGQVQISADLGIQLKGQPGSTPEWGPVLWMSGTTEFFFGTPKGIYVLNSGFVYGPSPELGGCIPKIISPIQTIQATQVVTPGSGTTQTVPLWADTPNSVCFLSASDEVTIFNKVTKRGTRATLGLPRSQAIDTIAWYGTTKYAILIVDLAGQASGDFRNNYILILDEEDGSRTRFDAIGYSPATDPITTLLCSSSVGQGPNPTDGIYTIRGCGGAGIFVKLVSAGTRRAVFMPYAGAKKYSQASAIGSTDYIDKFFTTDLAGVVPIAKIRTFPVNNVKVAKLGEFPADLGSFFGVTMVRCRVLDTPSVSAQLVYTDELGNEQITAVQTEVDSGWQANGVPYVKDIDNQPTKATSKVIKIEISSRTGQPFNVLAMMIDVEATF